MRAAGGLGKIAAVVAAIALTVLAWSGVSLSHLLASMWH